MQIRSESQDIRRLYRTAVIHAPAVSVLLSATDFCLSPSFYTFRFIEEQLNAV